MPTETMSRNIERDVYCAACGDKIDREYRAIDYRNSGIVTAMVCAEALSVHRRSTHCPGDNGWRCGPWSDESPPKPLCGKYIGDNDATCPQLTCIRPKGHEGLCDNVRADDYGQRPLPSR